jgi:hypothetical protein
MPLQCWPGLQLSSSGLTLVIVVDVGTVVERWLLTAAGAPTTPKHNAMATIAEAVRRKDLEIITRTLSASAFQLDQYATDLGACAAKSGKVRAILVQRWLRQRT